MLQLHLDGVANLSELVLDRRVVTVAIAVVLGEDVEGLVELVVGDEETRRLGHPPDEGDLDDGRAGLDEGRDSPRPVVVHVVGAKGDPRDCQGTDVPEAVVDGCEATTVLRMRDLGQEHGRRDLSQRVAETEQDATSSEDAEAFTGTLHDGTANHDDTANHDGNPSTVSICEDGPVGEKGDLVSLITQQQGLEVIRVKLTLAGWRPSCQWCREQQGVRGKIHRDNRNIPSMTQSSARR